MPFSDECLAAIASMVKSLTSVDLVVIYGLSQEQLGALCAAAPSRLVSNEYDDGCLRLSSASRCSLTVPTLKMSSIYCRSRESSIGKKRSLHAGPVRSMLMSDSRRRCGTCASLDWLDLCRDAVEWAEFGPLELDERLLTRSEMPTMVSTSQCNRCCVWTMR